MKTGIKRMGLKQVKKFFEGNLQEKFENNIQYSLEVDKNEEITKLEINNGSSNSVATDNQQKVLFNFRDHRSQKSC